MTITTQYADMPGTIPAYVVENNDMSYTIVLNSRMSYERNLKSYIHEMSHILNRDFEKSDVQNIESDAHS